MSRAADGRDMRELDCDFCGAAAAGAYEVLPSELDPTPDEQVRVVLCPDCRGTLHGVLAPLLDRLGADGGTGGATAPAPDGASGAGAGDHADAGTEYDAQANARASGPDSPSDDAMIIDASQRSPDADGSDEGGDDADDAPTGRDAATPAPDEPEGFRQVMRLLGNREFPVERGEVVDLAGSAYDLGSGEANDIVDYAVENDVLEEEDGRLWRA